MQNQRKTTEYRSSKINTKMVEAQVHYFLKLKDKSLSTKFLTIRLTKKLERKSMSILIESI